MHQLSGPVGIMSYIFSKFGTLLIPIFREVHDAYIGRDVMILECTPSVPKYKGFWLDVMYPSTMNMDRLYVQIHHTRMCHI